MSAVEAMNSEKQVTRRATGLVRTLVVACATLAILLVCFSIYQYSQLSPDSQARLAAPRLPANPTNGSGPVAGLPAGDTPGVPVGPAVLGPGRDITLTIYPREGQRARMEIAVKSWTPINATTNEFLLVEPEVRLRTKDGRGVRLTAREGTLQAQRKGGGLDPQRGRLTGDVVIEIDRFTEEERQSLPPAVATQTDASRVVRVELSEIEFDLEYSKVIVPRGGLHLFAEDIDFRASDLEIWFDEQEGRVDYLRINRGGTLALGELGQAFGLGLPGAAAQSEKKLSVVGWLRSAIQASLDARQALHRAEEPSPEPAFEVAEDGVPVFRPEPGGDDAPKPPAEYLARFEGGVDVKQHAGDALVSRLETDVLEIFRAFSEQDQQRVQSQTSTTAPDAESASPTKRLVLEWTGRLVLEACTDDNQRCAEVSRGTITATGSPTRVTSPDWAATCRVLKLDLDGSRVQLEGSDSAAVVVRSTDQGMMTGREVRTRRVGDALHLHVTGPGSLMRNPDPAVLSLDPASVEEAGGSIISFSNELNVEGRFLTTTSISFTGGISSQERSVFDRATFTGNVVLRENNIALHADSLVTTFGTGRTRRTQGQTIERLQGRGHVLLTQENDRVSCGEIDVQLTTDQDGRIVPLTATAWTDVEVVQDERTIRARDKLIVDFETVTRAAAPSGPTRAPEHAADAGADPAETVMDADETQPQAGQERQVRVRRLQAAGDVSVLDPVQQLDLTAAELDLYLVEGRDIDTAFLKGTEERPASVRLDAFTVVGKEIKVNVPDQWAEVPGDGRMTFQSRRDLDGRRLDKPVPIAITWKDSMKYRGRENRAVFAGAVHATSQTTTTFDCGQLVVEFDNVPETTREEEQSQDWWIFQDVIDRLKGGERGEASGPLLRRLRKEPAYLLATGTAIAETSEVDPATGRLVSRARLSGPRLSVNLRPEISKMLIEGPGKLLLEDFRPAREPAGPSTPAASGLFSIDETAGPSKTLIEWQEYMWYDFSIDQTRFEGDVVLKHFSGAELERLLGRVVGGSAETPRGRSTFLSCGVLTVDFLDRTEGARGRASRRMGGLSSDRLRQFKASHTVRLQDQSEGLSLNADMVIYEKARDLLQVYGTADRDAHIVVQRPGKNPNVFTTQRLFYNLATKRFDVYKPTFVKGR